MAKNNRRISEPEAVLLEHTIDSYTVAMVLRACAAICADKAHHLHSAWQDPESAGEWLRDGEIINDAARLIEQAHDPALAGLVRLRGGGHER